MPSLKTKLSKFTALSCTDRRTLLVAMALLPWFWLGLRLLGLHRFQAWLKQNHSAQAMRPTPLSPAAIQRIATLVNSAAGQPFIPATCLTRSLLLGWLLQRQGVGCQLHIGVRLIQGGLDAHAWVEYQGVVLNDSEDVGERYQAFEGALAANNFMVNP
jgi:hypothetical protein